MPFSTEVFVMAIFIAGFPFFYMLLRDAGLQGRNYFMAAYVCLLLSNIITVVEELYWNAFFNFCEHFFITLASMMMFVAILKLTTKRKRRHASQIPNA